MSKVVRHSSAKLKKLVAEGKDRTDWKRVKAMGESDIQLDQDAPEATAAMFAKARRGRGAQKKPTKRLVSLRLSREVLEHFRATGPGWQSRIDAALREHVGHRG